MANTMHASGGMLRHLPWLLLGIISMALALYFYRGPLAHADTKSPLDESAPNPFPPMAQAWVFARNIPAPGSPKISIFDQGMPRPGFPDDSTDWSAVDERFALGKSTFARKMPGWWMEFSTKLGIKDTKDDITLAFWGVVPSPNGTTWPVVVRLIHRFDGDGFLSPGPQVHLMAHSFERGPSGLAIKSSDRIGGGQMQFSRLENGRVDGPLVRFAIEHTGAKRAAVAVNRSEIVLSVGNDGTIKRQ